MEALLVPAAAEPVVREKALAERSEPAELALFMAAAAAVVHLEELLAAALALTASSSSPTHQHLNPRSIISPIHLSPIFPSRLTAHSLVILL
jgi:hypothetical protein